MFRRLSPIEAFYRSGQMGEFAKERAAINRRQLVCYGILFLGCAVIFTGMALENITVAGVGIVPIAVAAIGLAYQDRISRQLTNKMECAVDEITTKE